MVKLKEWQAILIAYGVLLVLAETEAGPLASLMAWGIAVTYFVDANLTQGNLLSSLFAAGPPSQAQQAAQGQANANQSILFAPGSPNIVQPPTTSANNNVTGYVP